MLWLLVALKPKRRAKDSISNSSPSTTYFHLLPYKISYFSEDLVLAEERTTEKDRKRIMEGKIEL